MSGKLTLPKKSYAGIKIFCLTCKSKNPKCRHFDKHRFRMHLHIPNTKSGERTKVLQSLDYSIAEDEAIEFKKEMIRTNYSRETKQDAAEERDYSLVDAILLYRQYLSGNHKLTHLQKKVTPAHRDECIRFCKKFAEVLKAKRNIMRMAVTTASQDDVAAFYSWADQHYAGRTFNKGLNALKAFFQFLIKVEKVQMANPFETYETKAVGKSLIQSLTKKEFTDILDAIETGEPVQVLRNGVRKNMYFPQLKEAFTLHLLTGGRREDVVTLRWSQITTLINEVQFFVVDNVKVMRQNSAKGKQKDVAPKYFPINEDLRNLLKELGYDQKKNTNDYVIYPNRTVTDKTLMDRISKSFTHYKKEAGIDKAISLADLRKTYLTWLRVVMQKQTGILSSHTTEDILDRHYIDPTVLSAVEKAALEMQIFAS
ncbi:MAG: hypothetical protein EOO51_14590 [Flavobacterium sp.]|nr:MAG: hypothetical protein EOO51_14590 [Flavobacterium sp.]